VKRPENFEVRISETREVKNDHRSYAIFMPRPLRFLVVSQVGGAFVLGSSIKARG